MTRGRPRKSAKNVDLNTEEDIEQTKLAGELAELAEETSELSERVAELAGETAKLKGVKTKPAGQLSRNKEDKQ